MQKCDAQKAGKMYENKRNLVWHKFVAANDQYNMHKKNTQIGLRWG